MPLVPQLAVAVLGPDRPGVIAALTEVLLADGGNLEDASMTILRGQFAMTLVVNVPRASTQVESDLATVASRLDLLVSVRETVAENADASASSPYLLRVHGADRPGLLHRATALLASYGANVTDLQTRLVGTAAAPVYVMVIAADVPAAADADGLAGAVAALARELDVEATLRPADDDLL